MNVWLELELEAILHVVPPPKLVEANIHFSPEAKV